MIRRLARWLRQEWELFFFVLPATPLLLFFTDLPAPWELLVGIPLVFYAVLMGVIGSFEYTSPDAADLDTGVRILATLAALAAALAVAVALYG